MSTTLNLNLALTDRSEWPSKKFSQFLIEMAGVSETSNMQIIDKAIGDLQTSLRNIDDYLSTI